jgi:hypothetical protein
VEDFEFFYIMDTEQSFTQYHDALFGLARNGKPIKISPSTQPSSRPYFLEEL